MKLVVTDGATLSGGGVSLDIFSQFGEVQIYDLTAPEQLAKRVSDADGILCNKTPIPAELFDRCPKLRYVGDTLAEAVLNGKQMELFEERSGDGTPTVRDGVTERHISGLHGRMRRAAVRYCCRKGVPGKIRIRAATIFQAPAIFRRAIHIWKGLCGKSARSSASTQRQRS